MDLIKLAVVFAVIIILLRFKKPLSFAAGVGSVLIIPLYGIDVITGLNIVYRSMISQSTLMVILNVYLITFLQRMMEARGHLDLAQRSLSRIFNNRRVNASVAPIFIGLLPSPGAIFIAGSMVDASCEDYLSAEDKTFVASYFRHISESFLPTYSSIIIACQLVNIEMGAFVVGMFPMVVLLIAVGYFFYLRKIPKETGMEPSDDKKKDAKNLFFSLWSIAAVIILIIGFKFQVYTATLAVIVVYFIVNKFSFGEVKGYFLSALESKIVINTFVVMAFKDLLTFTGVITTLPTIFEGLPIPTFLVFGLIFFFGTLVAGSMAIIVLCLPLAFATVPGAGLPLMVFLMSCTYAAMQVSPTHICLFLACDYFKTDIGSLIKRTLPVVGVFYVFLIAYYLIWNFVATGVFF